jgi:hypothetical protein
MFGGSGHADVVAEGGAMTEQEWLTAVDPEPMLAFLRGRATDRKLRLFGWECLRCTWPLLDAEWERMVNNPWWRRMRFSRVEIEWAKTHADLVRKGVELAEEVADGLADRSELEALFTSPQAQSWDIHAANEPSLAEDCFTGYTGADAAQMAKACAYRARYVAKYNSPASYPFFARFRCESPVDYDREQAAQCDRLRDVVGNPFRPVTFAPEWRTDTVLSLVRQMYESCDFGVLPILADALQDAGCNNEDILGHCRGPGPHVRGCWVVDLVLGKE